MVKLIGSALNGDYVLLIMDGKSTLAWDFIP